MIKYINSKGIEFDLQTSKFRIMNANFHSSSWQYASTALAYGIAISRFTKDAIVYSATIIFQGTKAERKRNIQNFFDCAEYDIANKAPGKLYWGDYYIECFMPETTAEPYEVDTWTSVTVSFLCPSPFWIKEETLRFRTDISYEAGIDYPHDYPHDYAPTAPVTTLKNGTPRNAQFKAIIYGACVNPSFVINGHEYIVYTTLQTGEYLTIDTRDKTIIKTSIVGTKTNLFASRGRQYYIFKPIPSGDSLVIWSGAYAFDLVLFEERSQPAWI